MVADDGTTSRVAREEDFQASAAYFGVLLTRGPQAAGGHLHSGVVFKRSGPLSRVGYLHVKWDQRIGERWGEPGVWASPECPTQADQDRAVVIAELADQVLRQFKRPRPGSIPYGIGWNGSVFARNAAGELVLKLGVGAYGLTCATLPLALCASVGLQLVAEETWPPRPAQDHQLLQIAQRFGPAHLVAQFNREIASGVRRIRPEEMVAAASHALPPIRFSDAVRAGEAIVSLLDSQSSPVPLETRITAP